MHGTLTRTRRKFAIKAFTLIELMAGLLLASIIILSMGFVMADQYRGWHDTYETVHGELATDSTVARRVFDRICRKASIRKFLTNASNTELTLFYFSDTASPYLLWPDHYAYFHMQGDKLMLDEGPVSSGTWDRQLYTNRRQIASNVSSIGFAISGASIQMRLNLNKDQEKTAIICSALRHN